MADNCPASVDILTSALKDGYSEIVSPRHQVFRSERLWDSNENDPSAGELYRSYSYILYWLFKRSREVKYRAVVAGAFDFANGFIIVLCKLLGISVIGLGNAEEFTLTLKGKGLKNFVKRQWLLFTHPRADGFIVVCDFCKDILASIGVERETITVVPSSINPAKLKPYENRQYGGRRVVSVGRLVERKGFHYLIEAVRRLKPEFKDLTLTIVGNGPFRLYLEKFVQDHQMQDYVFIKGGLPDEELSLIYQQSDLFVLAHVMLENGDTEGCPTVFSEASGCGLPVIGGVEGGASTVIVDGVTGYIVNPRNIEELSGRMKMILSDPNLAKRMGQAGIEKIKRDHNPERSGVAFANAIEAILSQSPVPSGALRDERVI